MVVVRYTHQANGNESCVNIQDKHFAVKHALYQIIDSQCDVCVCVVSVLTHLLESVADIADVTPCLEHWYGIL